jgi:putative ABC transport system ATP-binding protein
MTTQAIVAGQQPAETTATPLFRARGLVKSFGRTEALRGVDCDIAEGEVLAIMGPSGSGKSTLLHCLAGILRPDDGSVAYAGADLGRLDESRRSRLRLTDFGFVFQYGQLVPDLPAVENVALPLLLRGERRGSSMDAARRWLAELELEGFEQRLPGELSGGQAQRVALARAFAIGPRVLFADEPTGSLDSLAGEAVMEMLTVAARDHGVTVVLVTHDPRVAAYADREVVVRDGRIATGPARP